jgi:hypothetical protein
VVWGGSLRSDSARSIRGEHACGFSSPAKLSTRAATQWRVRSKESWELGFKTLALLLVMIAAALVSLPATAGVGEVEGEALIQHSELRRVPASTARGCGCSAA